MKRRQIQLSDRTWRAVQQRAEQYRKEHPWLPSPGRGLPKGEAGGRPPVMEEMMRELFLRSSSPARASLRGARRLRAVEAARVGFGKLYRPDPRRLQPYSTIERVVERATGADRPQRRIDETVGFCEKKLIAPFLRTEPRPTLTTALGPLVPEYCYGWGPVIYQSTLTEVP
ncbi:MAG: hypothetical protein ACRECR_06770 [Thermoplasmata archaeon]